MTTVPSVGVGGVTGAPWPSAQGRAPREQRCYDCGHELGMMLRKSSREFEELPPGLV
jgi:hypothetical protein